MVSFTQSERRASLGLASVFSLRMFGLFVILPVVALYANSMPGGESATLIGLAVGIYGLTQAIFQIPLGRLSDYWGRKKTIYLGLLIFILGSLVAASADSLLWLCIGRALESSWGIWDRCGDVLARPRVGLGPPFGRLGASCDRFGRVLGHLGSISGAIPRKMLILDRFLIPTSIPET